MPLAQPEHFDEGAEAIEVNPQTRDATLAAVRDTYAATASGTLSGEHAGVAAVAEAFGYSPTELACVPADANMGLSCGNPTAFASLKPGEVVVDLGCGGGLDVFLAARKVGPTGKAIGIDMTPEMIERRANSGGAARAPANVEFHLATIDRLPLADASADCVISNCVINLAPDKGAVFREVFRVLKPGGRLAVSDIALKKPLPPELAADLSAYVGCVAGAISFEAYRDGLLAAGFSAVQVIDSGADLNAYAQVPGQAGCCSPAAAAPSDPAAPSTRLPVAPSVGEACCSGPAAEAGPADMHTRLGTLLRRYDLNDYAASVKVYAVRAVGGRQRAIGRGKAGHDAV